MEPNELIVCRDASLGYEGQSVLAHLDLTLSLIHISEPTRRS